MALLQELRNALLAGDRRALAKSITLVESQHQQHREQADALLNMLDSKASRSVRLAISGPPGVGKSSFIEQLGLVAIEHEKSVAVLTIDPSSPLAGGSILGDKTRMASLARASRAFVRPSPAKGYLGGVGQRTREAIQLCEAAGFELIIVETVGVGQNEVDAAAMVDCFVTLLQPHAGDELQGLKKGVLELADLLVVNKADGSNQQAAELAQQQYRNALQLLKPSGFSPEQVLTCSSLDTHGVAHVWARLEQFMQEANASGRLAKRRAQQQQAWLDALFCDLLHTKLAQSAAFVSLEQELRAAVQRGEQTPLMAAKQIAAALRIDVDVSHRAKAAGNRTPTIEK